MNAAEVLGRDAGLALLAGDVDLDEDLRLGRRVALELAQRGVRRDRVDELGVRDDLLDLAALELADEVPAQLGVRGRLRLEVLGAVLARERDPGRGERADLLQRHVLDGGEDLGPFGELRADPLEVLADAGDVEPADQSRHTSPAWRPVTPWSRRWEKNSSASHIVHRPRVVDAGAGGLEVAADDLREVEVALADAGVAAVEDRVHLLADLVAAAARARADQRGHRARAADVAQRGDALAAGRPPRCRASRRGSRPRRRRRRAAPAGSRRRTRARDGRRARSPGRPPRRAGAAGPAARWRGGRCVPCTWRP